MLGNEYGMPFHRRLFPVILRKCWRQPGGHRINSVPDAKAKRQHSSGSTKGRYCLSLSKIRTSPSFGIYIFSYMPRLENSAGPSHPRHKRMILCCLRCTLRPSATGTSTFSKRFQHLRESGLPCGLHDSLCTLHLFCSSQTIRDSATGATLDTGGWLTLARQGLSPCKMH